MDSKKISPSIIQIPVLKGLSCPQFGDLQSPLWFKDPCLPHQLQTHHNFASQPDQILYILYSRVLSSQKSFQQSCRYEKMSEDQLMIKLLLELELILYHFNKFNMSTVTTYETLQTQGLVTINFSLISQNFKIIDSFIKAFPAVQRKIADLQKSQKATAQDLSNFKLSTQNTFSTLNDMVQSRSNASKGGSSLADNEEIKQIKKQFKQIKTFITQNTRQQHEAQQVRDKEATAVKQSLENKIIELKKELEEKHGRIVNLQDQNRTIKVKYTSKAELQSSNNKISQTISELKKSAEQVSQIQGMLENLDVKNMKDSIVGFQTSIGSQFEEMKRKLKLKADYSDVLKLEEMLLNIITFGHENSYQKFADKAETKKALIFLEKKMNRLLQTLFGEEEGDREGLVVTKGFKCISCTKDLGQMEGKLDKYKAWSVFPAKDPHIKDRYSGFGAGFQTIVQSTVAKKGVETTFDEKGKMTAPFNLTREVQGTLLKPSGSQSKLGRESSAVKIQGSSKNSSPTKQMPSETNYMTFFGKKNDSQINLRQEYMQKERGLMAHIKFIIQGAKNDK